MEPAKLYGFVLLIILVGFVIGVGVLAVDKFGAATTTTATATNESFNGINGTATLLSNDELVSVTAVRNHSAQSDTFNANTEYTIVLSTGAITMLNGSDNFTIDYTYTTDTPTSNAADSIGSEISAIASTWLGLLITIFVLAIVVSLVVTSFGFRGGR